MRLQLYTPQQLQHSLGLTKSIYQRLVKEGMPSIAVGRGLRRFRRRHDIAQVLEWLKERSERYAAQMMETKEADERIRREAEAAEAKAEVMAEAAMAEIAEAMAEAKPEELEPEPEPVEVKPNDAPVPPPVPVPDTLLPEKKEELPVDLFAVDNPIFYLDEESPEEPQNAEVPPL